MANISIMQALAIVLATAWMSALAGCATTQVKQQWRDPNYQATSGQRVLVIAEIADPDRRRALESSLVSRLHQVGVDAAASYTHLSVIGPKDLDAVRQVVERNRANTVLSVHLTDVKEETHTTGGHYGAAPSGSYAGGTYSSGGFYAYYPYAWQSAYNPPPTHTHQTYTTEARLFDMKSDKQVWAATMQSSEPSDFDKAAAEYADLVVKQLQDEKLILAR